MTPEEATAAAAACLVPGAPGWFIGRPTPAQGTAWQAVNVRTAHAVQVDEFSDAGEADQERWAVTVDVHGGTLSGLVELDCGPFGDRLQAQGVAAEVLRLAYAGGEVTSLQDWPAQERETFVTWLSTMEGSGVVAAHIMGGGNLAGLAADWWARRRGGRSTRATMFGYVKDSGAIPTPLQVRTARRWLDLMEASGRPVEVEAVEMAREIIELGEGRE